MDKKISAFIVKHHLLMLATTGDRLWCCSMFYVYEPQEHFFIVASDESTEHMQNVFKTPYVSGTVALETKTVGKIQGIQFAGEMSGVDNESLKELYFHHFPYARVMKPTLWKIRLDEIKMTDNTLGFGKKISWKRSS